MARKARISNPMTALERRAVFSLAGIFGLRIFGLFLILPVFAIYANGLSGATPFLIGLTLGAYGLTQAILQLPFGVLSDRWNRKKTIVLGLSIFALGSLIAGLSDSIYGVLTGRLIQGAGAISAAVIALIADLTREEQRTKAMAVIGIGIGFVFMASMILGPIFEQWIGVPGIFIVTAVAAVAAIPVLLKVTPEPVRMSHHQEQKSVLKQVGLVLRNLQLLQLDFGIFCLHAALTSTFVVVPFALVDLGGLPQGEHWKVYSSVMLLGVIGMLPFMAISHQREKTRLAMRLAVLILCVGVGLMMLSIESNWWGLLVGLALFFVGFNTMEATLPSLISRVAPIASKGTATGVYNSVQFFGVFVGGAASGLLSGRFGHQAALLLSFGLLLSWLLVTFIAPALKLFDSKLIKLDKIESDQMTSVVSSLSAVRGVVEVSLIRDQAVAYLKVDPDFYDEAAVEALIA